MTNNVASTPEELIGKEYTAGFVTDIDTETLPPGLSESVVREISRIKAEPEWLTKWRLDAFRRWEKMAEPTWAHVNFPPIDYQAISYFAAPKGDKPKSLDEVDPELLRTYEKLGIPLHEQKLLAGVEEEITQPQVAVDAVFDSVSITTTFKDTLKQHGVIFCSFSEAVQSHPEW